MCDTDTIYRVQGMTCSGCASKVSNAIGQIEGVTDTEVDLDSGEVTVLGPADSHEVRAAIQGAGYGVSLTMRAARRPPATIGRRAAPPSSN